MMALINVVLNGVFNLVMSPFRLDSAWPGLIAASLLTAIVLVGLFRLTSNPTGILRARNRFLARTLELLMFQHDLRVSLTACGRIFAANFVYLGQFLFPMLIGLVPLVLIFIQMESWFQYRPLRVGESAVLTAKLAAAHQVTATDVELRLPESARLDSPIVRSPKTNEVAWRIIATAEGNNPAKIQVAGRTELKSLVVGSELVRVSTRRESSGWINQFFAPSEPPLAAAGPIERLEISYPLRELAIGLKDVDWVLAAVVLMMLFSLVLGAIFGVRIA